MLAASYGQDDLLDDLLDRGADVRATNDSGSTALHHAAGAGNLHAIDRPGPTPTSAATSE